ncbi:MAG: hypothetical protein GWN00_25460, partial [Aliifodinibius sp.]|nr:hypothetical protein [Fodinibius sp.]NIY28026.1 hypothetical protein [Fodinibius sp.]
IAYASDVVNKLEIEGQIDIQSAERFRFAFISVLDGFKTGWFTRLHDENLVSTMVSLLADVENYTDYHKR